jgi:hypothetical protein
MNLFYTSSFLVLQQNTCGAWWGLWSMVGVAVGAHNRPGSFAQYFWWIPKYSTVSRNVQIAGLAAICSAIWKARNFFPKNPVELIYHAVVFMKYWAGSHVADDALQPNQGVDALLELAAGTATRRIDSAGASNTPRLMDRPADDMEVDGEDDEDADNLAE